MSIKLILTVTGCACLVAGCWGSRPANPGHSDGTLKECPDSPNCVSSQEEGSHYIDPIRYSGSIKDAKSTLLEVLKNMKRTEVITNNDNYIHAECTSLVFRFVDDVEFYFDDNAKLIHVRSASRIGQSDLGVNRKRVEKIREMFNANEGS